MHHIGQGYRGGARHTCITGMKGRGREGGREGGREKGGREKRREGEMDEEGKVT